MLRVNDLYVSYGGIQALKGICLTVNPGEIVSLIGANGAGKTTTLHTISGLKKAQEGSIELDGVSLTTTEPHKILSLGMAHVPEGRHIFSSLTVEENLMMGAYIRKDQDAIKKDMGDIYQLFPRLYERRGQAAGTLSGGEQQMLAMGRAMMGKPRLLLLDEPSMGLSPLYVKEIFNIIKNLNSNGMTILLVEQNARMALSISNRAYVLETGRIVMEGEGEQLLKNDQVRKAYLGA